MEETKRKQKLKMLYLMKILMEETDEGHPLSLMEIREKLEGYGIHAARKALYNDFDLLEEFGADLISQKTGKGTFYYIGSRKFQQPELKLLVDAIQSSGFITAKKSRELIEKIESLGGITTAEMLRRTSRALNHRKTANEKSYYAVDAIHQAIDQDRQMEFQYFRWTPDKKQELRHNGDVYSVSPWLLSWDNENYYLTAYDQEAGMIKNFRVDKILNPRLTERPREGREAFEDRSPEAYASCLFGMFTGDLEDVLIRADSSLAGVLIDRFGMDVEMTSWDENTIIARFTAGISSQFLGWLLSFGKQMEVISPRSLRDQLLQIGNELQQTYSRNPSLPASALREALKQDQKE